MAKKPTKDPARTPKPPDWNCTMHCSGGNGWRPDMVRFYPAPSGQPRPVRVTFVSWRGYALSAGHTHATIAPSKNPVWTGDAWAELWDDPQEKDEALHARHASFLKADRALRWVVRTLEKHFPAPVWEVMEWPEGWDPASMKPDAAEDAAVAPCEICGGPVGEHSEASRADCDRYLELVKEDAKAPEIRTLVDAGPVYGAVGKEILVFEDMHPSRVAELRDGCRALVVERGGATVHLAQVARELGITVMLMLGATTRFPLGTLLSIDPEQGSIS